MRIGIFGGTFNPPHVGHLIVIESVREQIPFEKIFVIPSAQTPNKPGAVLAPARSRLEMTRLAVEGNPHLAVSEIEIERKGISYTIDTVIAYSEQYPRADLSLIIGADNLRDFQSWKSPHEILNRVDLVVMNRPGIATVDAKDEFVRLATLVNVPQIGISGTDIRRRVKMGRSIRYLVPRTVEEYILHHKLYRD
ncbi:MAG TPA: nicotinate-nucleotide adenylyltransferase [Bacteroidota bacterium]|nr:nicotinate-nucleotide adenylyltransferase [Bacteroidota bacterium]